MTRNTRTASAKAAGSMKSVGRSGASVSVNRGYGSTKTTYSSRAKNDEAKKKNSGTGTAQKNTASAFTRNDSREDRRGTGSGSRGTRQQSGSAGGSSSEAKQNRASAVTSPKSMYNSDWGRAPKDSSRYTFEGYRDKKDKKDEDKVDVGQLLFGIGEQAANKVVGGVTNALDLFIGTPFQKGLDYAEEKLGLPDMGVNAFTAYNRYLQESSAREAEYFAENASKNKVASQLNQYAPDIVAVLPEMLLAAISGGTTAAASAGVKGLGAVSKIDNMSDAMKVAGKWLKDKPTAALNFLQTSGDAHKQALREGATEQEALAYALLNGSLDAVVSTVGLGTGKSGIESLPANLKNTGDGVSDGIKYANSIGEEVLEGQMQRLMQLASRGIYDENIKFVSMEDENALINPKSMLKDAAIDAVAPTAMSGVHAASKKIEASAANSVSRMQSFRYMDELMKANEGMDKDYALRQATLLQKMTNGMVLGPDELRELDMKNEAIQKLFTQKTGIAFSAMDNSRPDTLRQKFQAGAIKAKKGDIRVENTPQNLLEMWWDERYNKGAKAVARENGELKHGDWRNKKVITDGSQNQKAGRRKTLQQDSAYAAGENNYIYKTDSIGRPQNVTGVLLPKPEGRARGGHYRNTPEKIKGYDDAGHILADQFGGSPDLDNLLSQWSEINRRGGEYYKMEETWSKALNEGKEVYVDFDIHYPGDSKRPDWYDLTYYIDGEYTSKRIFNPLKA